MTNKQSAAASDRMISDFFSDLAEEQQQRLASRLKRIQLNPHTCLVKEGSQGQFLAIVDSGEIILSDSSSRTGRLTAGEYFGMDMLRHGIPSPYTAQTDSRAVIWVLNRADWLAITADPAPERPSPLIHPRFRKLRWAMLGAALSLLMIVFTLGPTLLDFATGTVPDLLFDAGRPQLAERYLRLVIKIQPQSAHVQGALGDLLMLAGKNAQAVDAYQESVDLDPYLPWVHNNLGVVLLEEGNPEQAVVSFQTAANLNPDSADAFRNLGSAYLTLEHWEAAADAYWQSMLLDGSQISTKAAWAGAVLHRNQLVESRLIWQDILQSEPRHPQALQGLGVISLLEDQPEEALRYLEAALYVDPQNAVTRLYLGLTLETLEKSEQAALEYQYIINHGTDPELIELAATLLEVIQREAKSGFFIPGMHFGPVLALKRADRSEFMHSMIIERRLSL